MDLPSFDRAITTRNICIAGLLSTWIIALACLVFGAYSLRVGEDWSSNLHRLPHSLGETLPLLFNVLITLCTDCLGYIHGTSLRWALWRENRLLFNSNLRLFTGARKSASNSYLTNAISACGLVFCYTGSSQMFSSSSSTSSYNVDARGVGVNSIALLTLGIGLFGQAFISSWSLLSAHIITWNSNPLNATLAGLHKGLDHQPKRCLLSATAIYESGPVTPSLDQPSARVTNPSVRWVTRLLWVLTALVICWASIILGLTIRLNPGVHFKATFPLSSTSYQDDLGFSIGRPTWRLAVRNILSLLVIAVIQSGLTLGLHCTELIVNVSRDEGAWRAAAAFTSARDNAPADQESPKKKCGAQLRPASITAASTSWQTIGLFIFKPLTHWLFGLGMTLFVDPQSFFGTEIAMRCMPLFALGGCALIISLTATCIVRHRPRGPQPAAWGHLQTLADLVDDWSTGEDGKLYWGDKGQNGNDTRHAGTSSSRELVSPIRLDRFYE